MTPHPSCTHAQRDHAIPHNPCPPSAAWAPLALLRSVLTLSLLALVCTTTPSVRASDAPDLVRRAVIGLGGQPSAEGGLIIASIRPDSPAARAGIAVGDRLLSIGGHPLDSMAALVSLLRTLPSDRPTNLVVVRNDEERTLTIHLEPMPHESVDGSKVIYGQVTVAEGYALRTILTLPERSPLAVDGRAPAFFFIQGLGCATLDRPQNPDAVDTRLVHAMAKAGYITLRVDKPGLGDSQGPPCEDIDFRTELEGYRAALKALKQTDGVDPDRVYLFGHSMGGVMAPLLSGEIPVRGSIVYGTAVRTWLEYQLENTRRQMRLAGASEVAINDALLREARQSAVVLIEKKTLAEVWSRYPELTPPPPGVSPEHLHTRHVSFFHQLQDLNLARAWHESTGHVLAVYGEYDWVTAQEDHDLIAQIVNARSPGTARSVVLPKMDHAFTVHPSLQASVRAMGRGAWDASLPGLVLAWIDEVEGRGPPRADARAADHHRASAQRAPTDHAAPGVAAEFPESWLGHWRGEATAGDPAHPVRFTMELKVDATDRPDRFQWTILYDGPAGRQVRPYTLLVKDRQRGEFQIDEGQGIVLEARLFNGVLCTEFQVENTRITSRDRLLDAGQPTERLVVEMVTSRVDAATATGGHEGVPAVLTWRPQSIQQATLRRITHGQTRPG